MPDNAEHLSSKRESRFLPGVRLDERIKVTRDLGEAARAERDSVGRARAGDALRGERACKVDCPDATPLVACAKGIEHGTHKFMTEIISECAPKARTGNSVGPELRRRRRARIADRRHDRCG